MLLKKIGWMGIVFLSAWLMSFGLSFWIANSPRWQDAFKKPLESPNLETGQSQTVGIIPAKTKIIEQIYYTKCHHLTKREILASELLPEANEQTLKKEGWAIYHNSDGSITISKNVEGVCPEDMKKRHLGVSGEYVAIYEGPVGVPGKLLKVLDVKVAKLPKEWQEKVKKGELNFSSEEELLQALDSIDEYE